MAQWKVYIIESESGWGQRVDETMLFDDHQQALDFVVDYNSENDLDYVPSWYMYADSPVEVKQG
jgi:hypothetical protein